MMPGWLRKFSRKRQAAAVGNFFAQEAEDVRIGAAETIDRLLEIAHEKQLAAA